MANDANNHSQIARIDREARAKAIRVHNDVKPLKERNKTEFAKWFSDMFLSGRTWKDIVMDIINNQVVPEIKDSFRNSVVSLLDMRLYKDHTISPGSKNGTPTSFTTNYVQYSDKKTQQKAALEANKKKEEETLKSGYEIPSFKTLQSARVFLQDMHDYVNQYYRMSVLDLASMQGAHISYTWDKYGWEKEEILAIKEPTHISNPDRPYIVKLPKAHVLTDD